MRTEKSPLRIACSACSKSSEGFVLPLPEGFGLPARRVTDGVAEPRSLMKFPLRTGAPESGLRRHKTGCGVADQAGTPATFVPPAGTAPKQSKVPRAIRFHGFRKKVPPHFERCGRRHAPPRGRHGYSSLFRGFAAATSPLSTRRVRYCAPRAPRAE